MLDLYKIKTSSGYYYSTGNGRYGRVDGTALEAWVLCGDHAALVVKMFDSLFDDPDDEPFIVTKEKFNGHAKCSRCQIKRP